MRYLEQDDYRCLTACEMGMKNHEWVPLPLIESISKIRRGGVSKIVNNLLRLKLLQHTGGRNEGYQLSFEGYDYLALHAFFKRGKVSALGSKCGVGKEADIYMACDAAGNELVVKFQRLGRTSFREVKNKRDYMGNRQKTNWLYMSRLAALKEFAYMKALFAHGFPTPVPVDINRHAVVMSLVDGYQLNTVREIAHPDVVYAELMELICRMARHGVVHGDFNEFNLMISKEEVITMIDFPQMLPIDHREAREYFDRDVGCIVTVFKRKYGFESTDDRPVFDDYVEAALETDLGIKTELRQSGLTDEIDDAVREAIKEERDDDEDKEEEKDEEEESDGEEF